MLTLYVVSAKFKMKVTECNGIYIFHILLFYIVLYFYTMYSFRELKRFSCAEYKIGLMWDTYGLKLSQHDYQLQFHDPLFLEMLKNSRL